MRCPSCDYQSAQYALPGNQSKFLRRFSHFLRRALTTSPDGNIAPVRSRERQPVVVEVFWRKSFVVPRWPQRDGVDYLHPISPFTLAQAQHPPCAVLLSRAAPLLSQSCFDYKGSRK